MKQASTNLAAASMRSVRWNYLGSFVASLSAVGIGIVLARILGPRPFGQVIIASTIYGFMNLFVDGGFSQALIQKADLSDADIRKTFTTQVGIGMLMTALVCAAAPWIAQWFHDPQATPVIRAMGLIIVIQSTGLVAAALLRRNMRFRAVQISALCSYLFGFLLIGIPLALRGAGVWSLVIAYLAQCGMNSVLLHCAARHPIAPILAWPDRSILSFGGTIVANNLVNWGHSNIDNIAASGLGPVALGLYGRASNFAYQPVTAVVNGIQSVLFSATARAQEKRAVMRKLTLAVLGIALGVLGPAYATFAMIPATTITGLYGDKWVGVIPLMIPFALAMPFYGAHCLLGPILCGLGKPQLEFWPQAFSLAFAAVAYFAAARVALAGIAWALLAVMLVRLVSVAAFTFRLLQIRWSEALLLLVKRALFSALFGAAIWAADFGLRLLGLGASLRLALLALLCGALLSSLILTASNLVFGRQATQFLLAYANHLPGWYVRRLRAQPGLRMEERTTPA